MKKNTLMRIASVLLVVVLATTCVISGTFAKYVTSSTGSDTARVAYWGFDAPAALDFDLFDNAYDNAAVNSVDVLDPTGADNVVAPGTSKTDTFAFGYTNYQTDKIAAPEVAYTFAIDCTITGDTTAFDDNDNFKWTLKAPGAAEATKYDTVAELIAAVELLSGHASGTQDYAAGELPDAFTAADEVYTIGWVWEFSTDTAGDTYDTELGNSQDLAEITLSITITATQKDTVA